MASDDGHWMEKAHARMERKHSLGSFGKATEKNIAAGRKTGGVEAKKANFAAVAKKIANDR